MVTATQADRPATTRSRAAALRELALVVGLYVAYSATRLAVGGQWGAAREHADQLLRVERDLHLDVELWLNTIVTPVTWLAVPSSYWYATMHFVVTPAVLVLLYRKHPVLYRPARTALMAATLVALLGYYFFPTAPPRLVGGGYVDTLSATSQYGWWPSAAEAAAGGGSVTNQVAAMPSMHVGWALWVSIVLAALARRWWLKVLAFGYVATTTSVVVLTANHWVLDAVAGVVLVGACWVVASRAHRPPPASTQAPVHDLRRPLDEVDDGRTLAAS
ncbi:hypothetical protein Cch01nite_11860 [Cellulomonas chitinilytica]|uniref:Inositolphosphotransferase Aur1/Ipt1 domain-containing protein n=1 Tax=Cellulomonas chitinilytica TaxID=398759 RepID=A0A919P1K5_9CELL|nr:phosphatase PAP2 family protein [Cellulomonas chitinilytica]GIG20462.1 hypothetical protein Cch01nite_11860 [Cellulomonas chitinilytica]